MSLLLESAIVSLFSWVAQPNVLGTLNCHILVLSASYSVEPPPQRNMKILVKTDAQIYTVRLIL